MLTAPGLNIPTGVLTNPVVSQATLAALPTANGAIPIGSSVTFVNNTDGPYAANPVTQSWQLVAGNFGTAGKYQQPADFNGLTNEVVWMQTQ